MSKFQQYYINLKDLQSDSQALEYTLDDVYFQKIDSPEVKKGIVNAIVNVKKKLNVFELTFILDGIVQVPCNRCLDDMDQSIQHKEKLQVKFGDQFSEEEDTVVVPESDGGINVAWFLYEFVVLNIPIKHVHATGECNKTMITKLKKHITRQKSDDDDETETIDFDDEEVLNEETPTDPRWDGLQNIFENN